MSFSLCICTFCYLLKGVIKSHKLEIIDIHRFTDIYSLYFRSETCLCWPNGYDVDGGSYMV